MNVSIEILEFSLCVKNIIFKNTNLVLIEPHNISNNTKEIVLLCYKENTTVYMNIVEPIWE